MNVRSGDRRKHPRFDVDDPRGAWREDQRILVGGNPQHVAGTAADQELVSLLVERIAMRLSNQLRQGNFSRESLRIRFGRKRDFEAGVERRDDVEIDAVVGPSAALANLDPIVGVVPNRAGRVGDHAQGTNERERALVDGDGAVPLPFDAAAPGNAQRQRRLGGEQRVEVGRKRRHHKPRQQPDDPRREGFALRVRTSLSDHRWPSVGIRRRKTARNGCGIIVSDRRGR